MSCIANASGGRSPIECWEVRRVGLKGGVRMRVRACLLIAACCLLVLASCSEDSPSGPSHTVMDRITDFRITDTGYYWAELAWDSLGADPVEYSYDVRYLHSSAMGGEEEITEALWAVADTVAGEPLPSEAGVAESLMVSHLVDEESYYMAVRTMRHADGELSDISNTVLVTTDAVFMNCASPNLAIPDDNPTGVTSVVAVTRDLSIKDVDVGLHIIHTWIGDLIVELTSPGGTTVRLHNRTGSNADDIFGWYGTDQFSHIDILTVDGPGSLDDFDGESSLGDWTLWVSDNAGLDLGTFVEWCVLVSGVDP